MAIQQIVEGVYSLKVNHWDRELFDELIPLPDGTSYNAYFIKGTEKNALIDTADPALQENFLKNIKSLNLTNLDYIVANHAEQDHSGLIPEILKMYPSAKVVTNPKCKSFLISLLHIDESKFIEVKDNETLSLGGKTLEFIYTPFVHWPETMSTYLVEDKILFSCDFFGSHRAVSHLFVYDEYKVIEDAKRYYAEIMMPFRTQIKKNIEKVESRNIKYIAPSHGLVYDKPEIIINAYKDWISDNIKKKVLIPYISMHDSTKIMVDYVVDAFTKKDMEVIPMNMRTTDVGKFAMEVVDASTVILASPYVLAGVHPAIIYSAYLFNALRPKTRYISIMVSYGWGGQGVEQIKNLLSNIKAELIEPVKVNGNPTKDDFKKLDDLVEDIVLRHKKENIV